MVGIEDEVKVDGWRSEVKSSTGRELFSWHQASVEQPTEAWPHFPGRII